jgi:hypothetical protein
MNGKRSNTCAPCRRQTPGEAAAGSASRHPQAASTRAPPVVRANKPPGYVLGRGEKKPAPVGPASLEVRHWHSSQRRHNQPSSHASASPQLRFLLLSANHKRSWKKRPLYECFPSAMKIPSKIFVSPGASASRGGYRPWPAFDLDLDSRETKRADPRGSALFGSDVRRCPTLPRGLPRSTIGAEGLNFRVRDGTGCFPLAMAAATLWKYQP